MEKKKDLVLVMEDTPENRDFRRLPCLPGTRVRYDEEGNIVYDRWLMISRAEFMTLMADGRDWVLFHPDNIGGSDAQRRYLADLPVVRKRAGILEYFVCRQGLEAAIRLMGMHVAPEYKPETGSQAVQMEGVLGQIQRLRALFINYSDLTDELIEEARHETADLLIALKLDTAKLRDKQLIFQRVLIGAGMHDSLGRKNLLISLTRLHSAFLKALKRQGSFAWFVSKYELGFQALLYERRATRWAFEHTTGAVRDLLGHMNFRNPGAPVQGRQPQIVARMIRNIAQGPIDLTKLKPYLATADLAQRLLIKAAGLVEKGQFQEAKPDLELAAEVLQECLVENQDIGFELEPA